MKRFVLILYILCVSSAFAQDVEAPATPRHWVVTDSRSPIDDSMSVTFTLIRSGEDFHPLMILLLRYREHEWDAILSCSEILDSEPKVTVRFDKTPAETVVAYGAKDRRGAFSRNPKRFIRRLLTAQQLVVRLYPEFRGPITETFDVAGLEKELAKFPEVEKTLAESPHPEPPRPQQSPNGKFSKPR
jgi:hypothetical protein